VRSRSPYAGLMWWHHYTGLIFGLAALTWIFSGLLSMDPWNWSPGTAPSRPQREALSGGPLELAGIRVDDVRAAAAALASGGRLVEAELVQFDGERFLRGASGLVPLTGPGAHPFARFSEDAMLRAARRAMPGRRIEEAAWLDRYDAYYYDRKGELGLPVLRAKFADPQRTWLYLDPSRGEIVRKEERLSRVNRWLYHGLHSLDFSFLYYRRPLWDVVVIVLSLGGLALSATTISASWHRLKRHGRRWTAGRPAGRPGLHRWAPGLEAGPAVCVIRNRCQAGRARSAACTRCRPGTRWPQRRSRPSTARR
jgi:hypothetical protein